MLAVVKSFFHLKCQTFLKNLFWIGWMADANRATDCSINSGTTFHIQHVTMLFGSIFLLVSFLMQFWCQN